MGQCNRVCTTCFLWSLDARSNALDSRVDFAATATGDALTGRSAPYRASDGDTAKHAISSANQQVGHREQKRAETKIDGVWVGIVPFAAYTELALVSRVLASCKAGSRTRMTHVSAGDGPWTRKVSARTGCQLCELR